MYIDKTREEGTRVQIKKEKLCQNISKDDELSLIEEPVDRNLSKLTSNNDKLLKSKFQLQLR